MTYQTANDQLTGRNKSRRKIANNTYLERRDDGSIAVRLHNTDIVTYKENGDIVLNSGGWKTVTTKARMNEYIAKRIWSDRGVWYLGTWGTGNDVGSVPYADGMTLHSNGTVSGEGEDPKASLKLKKQIKAY